VDENNIHIYLESNPNPGSLKFVLNFMLFPEGLSYDFPDVESTGPSPLARGLFGFEYVERVFFMNNFITITKSESVGWENIQHELKAYIKEYLALDKPVFDETLLDQEEITNDPDIVVKIKGVLDEYVRPAVEQDGGAIVFQSFDEGVVTVALQGSCSGCPSSTITLKAGIENILTTMIPEVKRVEAESV